MNSLKYFLNSENTFEQLKILNILDLIESKIILTIFNLKYFN